MVFSWAYSQESVLWITTRVKENRAEMLEQFAHELILKVFLEFLTKGEILSDNRSIDF